MHVQLLRQCFCVMEFSDLHRQTKATYTTVPVHTCKHIEYGLHDIAFRRICVSLACKKHTLLMRITGC